MRYHKIYALALILHFFIFSAVLGQPKPVVFKVPDSNEPGDMVMLYGGYLQNTKSVLVSQLANGPIGQPAGNPILKEGIKQPIYQPTAASIKFQLPASFAEGLYGVKIAVNDPASAAIILNRPELWFLQPVRLQPGLIQNEVYPGSDVQIVGKNILLPHDKGTVNMAIKAENGVTWHIVPATRAERFSLWATLPANMPAGNYNVCVSNGFGASAGWSAPLPIVIKNKMLWPDKVFNVKDFGAKGDDIHDDSKSVQDALAAANKNNGGVVYFPWGTYRINGYIVIPPKTTIRGDNRDGTQLKWPVDQPKALSEFTQAAIYGLAPYAIENVTLIARKVDCILLDISASPGIPAELKKYIKPWRQTHDVFLRNVNFQHWLLASHPENASPEFVKKYSRDGAVNFKCGNIINFEVSNCIFEGGNNTFFNIENARECDNSFSNTMGYCWTTMGGGAHYVVCQNNTITASSSWGYGQIGMEYVYSAHNVSRNFVTGEREAMTLDISALPTQRPESQYWGSPVEVGNESGNAYLRFPDKNVVNADGFRTGFVPGCFRGATVFIRGYNGGKAANQSRKILDNTEDKIMLESPFQNAPDTVQRKGYMEIVPRGGGGNTAAWFGLPQAITATTIQCANKLPFVPQEFSNAAVMVLDGPGAGQYRNITANTENIITICKPWDVMPDETSTLGIWFVMRHMVVYKSEGYDASAFAQLYGSFYDYTVDECHVERNQGIWGQSGWFVNFRYNNVLYGTTYHPGIGPHGANPEGNLDYSFLGLTDGNLRISKFGVLQYPEKGKLAFVNDVLPHPIPGALGTVIKANKLSFNQRIAFPPEDILKPRKFNGIYRFIDIVIDKNMIEHSPVGIQIGSQAGNVITSSNQFIDVERPVFSVNSAQVVSLDKK